MADHAAVAGVPPPMQMQAAHPTQAMVSVAAIQMFCSPDSDANIRKAESLVRDAAAKGAQIILLQELFATTYFPMEQADSFRLAVSVDDDRSYLTKFRNLAKELSVVLPLSFYERANPVYFNTVVVFDADGSSLGTYRKSHIPDSPGYHEKWHFAPGDTGFRVFKTRYATIGVGICWDQWFPEAARCMVLLGAEILLYPTAIGSEPQDPTLDTSGKWQRCMQGHAAANLVPVVAANRIGRESGTQSDTSVVFYGSSFITDHTGVILADAGRHQETVLTHSFNLADLHSYRLSWGVFRDRRPDLYHPLISLSGGVNPAPRGGYGGQGQFHISTAGGLAEDTSRKMVAGLETHEASFIGDVKASAQRRPRGRCWSCRAKTTYECKACEPGPVPLCNRTARDCWWKYHAGEVTPFVPNKRGRKRKKLGTDVDDDDDSDPKDPLDPDAAAAAAAAAAVVVGTVPGAVAIVD